MTIPLINQGESKLKELESRSFGIPTLPAALRYNYDHFRDRLDVVSSSTAHYGGQLQDGWNTRQPITPPFDIPALDLPLSRGEEHQLDSLVQRAKNAHIGTAVIEAAHVYLYEDLDNPELLASIAKQTQLAAELTARLKAANIEVNQVLFVDDYNEPLDGRTVSSNLDIDRLISIVAAGGYQPSILLREGNMVGLAEVMISALLEQGLAYVKKSQDEIEDEEGEVKQEKPPTVLLKRHGIELYRSGDNMVSCTCCCLTTGKDVEDWQHTAIEMLTDNGTHLFLLTSITKVLSVRSSW